MKQFIFLCITLAFFIGGCSDGVEEQPEEDSIIDKVEADDSREERGENGSVQDTEDKRMESDANSEVSFGGIVSIEDETIVVDGESNLPEGTVVEAMRYKQPFTLRHVIGFGAEQTKVNDDGSFQMEIPLPTNYDQSYIELALEVKMSHAQPEAFADRFGEKGEKLQGPAVYPYDLSNEKRQKVYVPVYILVGGEETEYPIEAPKLKERPVDYGETEVWVETEVRNDHRYIYVEGASNFIVGTKVQAVYYSSEEAALPQHWFSSMDFVEKDGSFLLRIPYDSITEVGFIEFSVWPDYGHQSKILMNELYGENFENIEGEQVTENEDGQKGIEFKLHPNFPEVDFNLPDESRITVDGEETKIQLPDDILFDFGESELRGEAKQALNDFLGSLEALKEGTAIEINGHTDNSGGEQLNQELSEKRANAVENYLIENGDLSHLSIETNGYGFSRPVASNDDEEGRQKNRRVEFVINPK